MDINTFKKNQARFADEAWAPLKEERKGDFVYEGNPHHDYFRAKPFAALHALLQRNGVTLDGKTLLVASCGTGIDVHYLRKYYRPTITVSDISDSALGATLARFPDCAGEIGDTEALPFGDDEFDFAFVAGALHHLPRPLVGLYELLRVARQGAIVIEPNDSWLTRWATRLGCAHEYEKSGNYVYRLASHDLARVSRSLYAQCDCVRLFAPHKVAKSRAGFHLLKTITKMCNALVPSWGNYLVALIQNSPDEAPAVGVGTVDTACPDR